VTNNDTIRLDFLIVYLRTWAKSLGMPRSRKDIDKMIAEDEK